MKRSKSSRIIVALVLLLLSACMALSACQNKPVQSQEPLAAEEQAPVEAKEPVKRSALDKIESFFDKPLGLELTEGRRKSL